MNFAQWLFLQENVQSNKFQSREERVKSGKSQESKIIRAMIEEHKWDIRQVTENQDKYDKIDGVLVSCPNPPPVSLPAPVQIKYRDTNSGDDVLMEVVWQFRGEYETPLNQLLTGRDMKGAAKLYLCLNKLGTLVRARIADEAKSIARKLLEGLLASRKRSYSIGRSQIRLTEDPESRRPKINAYIDPNDPSFSWKQDYPVMDLWSSESQEPLKQTPAQILPKDVPPSIIPAIAQALETGSSTFAISNNARKVRAIEKYVNKRGLDLSVENGQIILRKVA
jgi:hypothetical protein